MSRELVLVTGATGALGPSVVAALTTSGYSVRTFSRHHASTPFSGSVDERVGDITDAAAVAPAMTGVHAVVHLAARLHFAGLPSRDIDAYRRVNVEGTGNVVSAAAAADAQRVVLASTIAVYGSHSNEPVNELSTPRPDTPYAVSKLAAEDIVRNARSAAGAPTGVVLRLAAVYGSRLKGNYASLVRALVRHRFVPIGDGRSLRTLVHEHDVARAIVHVLQTPHAAGRIYNVTDGSVHTTDEIVGAICGALRRPGPRWRAPESLAFGAAIILDELHRLTGGGAGTLRDRLMRYVENVAVDGSAIQRELNFKPEYTLQRGWQRVVDEMKMRGDLL